MKIAITHDHYLISGGAERVLVALLRQFPSADVFLAFASRVNYEKLSRLTSGRITISPWQHLLFHQSLADFFKPVLFSWWESLDVTKYDVVISSSHSFSSKSVIVKRPTRHIAYIHTPPRYLYNEFSETRWVKYPLINTLLYPLLRWMRKKDFEGAQRPDVLIANSKEVQKRIKKYYRRESIIVYPSIETINNQQKINNKKIQGYFLFVGRLVRQKGIELAIRACNELGERLVVVGSGLQKRNLERIAGPNIEFMGFISDDRMSEVYEGAQALLYPSIEEDFGIVPVEAMAHGVPVLAYFSGGAKETVVNGKTGLFFNEHTVQSVIQAILRWEKHDWKKASIKKYARKFSEQSFTSAIRKIINQQQETSS